jgi:hypothetical protein
VVARVRGRGGCTVGADAAAGGATCTPAFGDRGHAGEAESVRPDDGLVEAATQLDPREVAPLPVHRVVVPGWQENWARVVVR